MWQVQWFAMICIGAVTVAFAASKGTAPRPSANKYAAHAENDGVAIGVTRLSASQLRKAFALDKATSSDLDESCFVAVIAKLPYVVQVGQNGGTGPMMGPRPSMDPGTGGVYHDPVTGMPTRRGTHTPRGTDAGTGAGESGSSQTSGSGLWRDLEMQMMDKALPEGSTVTPVAGYIYFTVEKKTNARYELEYTVNGKKVVLPL